jgi:signal transduction histidine kinase
LIDLSFADDGIGIAADALVHIFEPFYTTKRGQGGTGLGLHIVFNLVTAKLGGRIEASGAPGMGIRFNMRIPISAP